MTTNFPKPLDKQVAAISDSLSQTQDGLAIVANGKTHAAISSGQFVYVKGHDTLSEGLYKATSAIAANGTLSTSNLTPDGSGGLNDLQGQLTTLNSNIHALTGNKKVKFVGGVARYYNGTWSLLNNDGHSPMNVVMADNQTSQSSFRINHEINAKKVISFVCGIDDSYAMKGVTCGASVGVDYSVIDVAYLLCAASIIQNSSGASSYTHTIATKKDIVSSIETKTSSTLGSYLRINLNQNGEGMFQVFSNNKYDWKILGFSSDYINVQPYLSGTKQNLPLPQGDCSFTVMKQILSEYDGYDHTNCNIWFLGAFEV